MLIFIFSLLFNYYYILILSFLRIYLLILLLLLLELESTGGNIIDNYHQYVIYCLFVIVNII